MRCANRGTKRGGRNLTGREKSMDTLFGLLQLGLMAAFSIIWMAVLSAVLWSKIARNGETAHAPRPTLSPAAADKV